MMVRKMMRNLNDFQVPKQFHIQLTNLWLQATEETHITRGGSIISTMGRQHGRMLDLLRQKHTRQRQRCFQDATVRASTYDKHFVERLDE
jgi:hypothetical protein